jgi:hypothetical protein
MLCIKVALDIAAALQSPAFKSGLKKCIKEANKIFLEKIPEETLKECFIGEEQPTLENLYTKESFILGL